MNAVYTKLISGPRIVNSKEIGSVQFWHHSAGEGMRGLVDEGWEIRIFVPGSASNMGRRFTDKFDAHEYYLTVTGAYVTT